MLNWFLDQGLEYEEIYGFLHVTLHIPKGKATGICYMGYILVSKALHSKYLIFKGFLNNIDEKIYILL